MPVFKPGRWISKAPSNVQVSYVDGEPKVLSPGLAYPDFKATGFSKGVKIEGVKPNVHTNAVRANMWRYVDYDGDGAQDLIIGVGDWKAYGWDNAYTAEGVWTNGPLHGLVYVVSNRGTTANPKYADPVQVLAGGRPVDVFGWPSPNFADWDGDGDLDLLCGEFLDGFTYFANINTRREPVYASGLRVRCPDGQPLAMDLQMITPTAVDWDKDGDLDLICGDEDGRVAFIENTGRLDPNRVPQFLAPRYFRQVAQDVKFGALVTPVGCDWDGDGDWDLICGNTAGYIAFIENLSGKGVSQPKWAEPRRLEAGGQTLRLMAGANGSIQGPAEAKWGYTTQSVADWDGDGLPDIVANSILGKVHWYRNIGTRTVPKLAEAQPLEIEWVGPQPCLAWGWLRPEGKALLTQWRTTPVTVDWNKDGLVDLMMLDQEGYLAFFARAIRGGKRVLLSPTRVFCNEKGEPIQFNTKSAGKSGRRKLCVTDWDGDGRLDILVNSKNAEFWRQVGEKDGRFLFKNMGGLHPKNIEGHDVSPTVADFDDDGIPDFIGGAEDGHLYFLHGSRSSSAERVRSELCTPILEADTNSLPAQAVWRVLNTRVAEADTTNRLAQAGIKTLAELTAWQQRTRQSLINALGGFPEPTPLHARVTGTVQRDGYRVEKILFESRPNFYVTALLFLPDQARFMPPYPGILVPCGHSEDGKALPAYQRGSLLAAANGMAALVYDPIDQGERLQGNGKGGVHGHNVMGVSAILLGWNTATFRIWDGLRALDYLASRPDIDSARLGCMGNSGGGTLTTYLSALDQRIVASAPACYISSWQQVCQKIGPQDAEQNLFGQLAFGLGHSGWLLLRAPAATCVCAAQKDFFPLPGTRESVSEVSGVYTRLGMPERILLVEHDGEHGWSDPLRLAAVKWMNRWLRQTSEIAVPPELDMGLVGRSAWVTESGQVMGLPGARSAYDILRDEAARLVAVRGQPNAERLRSAVRHAAVIRDVTAIPVPSVAVKQVSTYPGGEVRRLVMGREGGLEIPAVLFLPDHPSGKPVLVADGLGKSNAVARAAVWVAENRPVLVADVCAFGETCGSAHAFYGAANKDEELAVLAYLLGRPLVGMRAEDLLVCARWLSGVCGKQAVELFAANWAVTPALHAAVAEPHLFAEIQLSDAPLMWEEVVAQGARHRLSDVVHGALRDYGVGDLKRQAVGLGLTRP
jgi:hypothetical protein